MMKNPVRLVNRVNFEKELQEKKLECEDMIRKYLPKEEGFAAQRWKTAASDPDGRDISGVWRNIGYH